MTDGKEQDSALALLIRAARAFRDDIETVLLADEDATSSILRELRGGQRRLLTLIPITGARGTDLANRLGITKQALGELAVGLENAGLLTAVADPTDGRARIWRLTPAGEIAADAARRVLATVEAGWRDLVGARDYDHLIRTLRRLHALRDTVGQST
jgi:DNA-binding MarR family transcriptional regulator